ncbi:hypothetical protein [Catenulispora pinisilvae]|uniref:hypothetical protein n=1 Tax=Catenulispora pinisilvae TaxID=2705253 RepID=UPI001891DA66|nr:hypothetical protein [Catenulispora pinisilvae]
MTAPLEAAPSLVTTAENGSIRVVGAPWRAATDDHYGHTVLIHRPHVPKGTFANDQQFRDGLTDEQVYELAAVHEAGHAVLYALAGVPIDEVCVYQDNPQRHRDDGRPSSGHTLLADPLPTLTVAEYAIPVLAGQVAVELWLERCNLETPWRRLMAQVRASGDHELLLFMTTARCVAWLYGDAEPPEGWSGTIGRVDLLIDETRSRLEASWDSVDALAKHLVMHARADANTVKSLM